VVRGGSFYSNGRGVRCAVRGYSGPGYRVDLSAFRVVVSPSHP
jgi:formylglycine-generating enzyme required for sulfatase activity